MKAKVAAGGRCAEPEIPAAPAATPAGFGLSKRPANTQLPVITRRRCNGVSTALQIPLQGAQCVNFPQKHSFPQKHLNCGETMPEFSARYACNFWGYAKCGQKTESPKISLLKALKIQIRLIRRNREKCRAGKRKFHCEEDVPHRAVFLGKAILNPTHTSFWGTKYSFIYSHCIAKSRRTAVYGVKTDP